MSALAIVNLVVFAALLSFLFQLSKRGFGFSKLVLIGLVLGTLFGSNPPELEFWTFFRLFSVQGMKSHRRQLSGQML